MILEDHPSPTLTWTSRLCLLAMAVIVLPLSLVAVGDDESSASPSTSMESPAILLESEIQQSEISDDIEVTPSNDDQTDERPQDSLEVVFSLKNITVGDVIKALNTHFADADVKPSVTVVESITDEPSPGEQIKVRLKPEQKDAVAKIIAHLEERSGWTKMGRLPFGQHVVVYPIEQDSGARAIGLIKLHFQETERPPDSSFDKDKNHLIVRGTEAQHEVVTNIVTTLRRDTEDSYDTIDVARVQYEMPEELAIAFEDFIKKNANAFDVLDVTYGSHRRRSEANGSSVSSYWALTVTATEELQQWIGNFIGAFMDPKQPQDKVGDDLNTMTLARATYDIGFEQKVFVEVPYTDEHPLDGKAPLPRFRRETRTIKRVATELVDLLKAIPSGGQYPVLLVKSNAATLTVTTTPEFQEALGKFIAFLKERAPADDVLKTHQDAQSIILPELRDPNDEASRTNKAIIMVKQARKALNDGDFGLARRSALFAQKLTADYGLFSDRPEYVLKEIEKLEASLKTKRQNEGRLGEVMIGHAGDSLCIPEQQLASLRMQERMIGAELTTINNAIQKGGNRTALSLLIGRNHADNAITRKLVEMLGQAIELEQEKQQLLNNHSMQHPAVLSVQARIDALREMMGLPAGKETQLTELLIIHVESLKLQQQLLRESIEALEESQAESKAEADAKQSFKRVEEQLSPLLSKEAELLKSHGPEHPEVISVQRKIEMTREFLLQDFDDEISDDSPLKLLQLEVERLQDVIRKLEAAHPTDDALPNNTPDEFKPRDEEQSSNNSEREQLDRKLRELEADIKAGARFVQVIKGGLKAGGELEGVRRLIAHINSDHFRKSLLDQGFTDDDYEGWRDVYMLLLKPILRHQELLQVRNPDREIVRKVERDVQQELDVIGATEWRSVKKPQYMQVFVDFLEESGSTQQRLLENLKRQRRELEDATERERLDAEAFF